jgi:hypothetical protein
MTYKAIQGPTEVQTELGNHLIPDGKWVSVQVLSDGTEIPVITKENGEPFLFDSEDEAMSTLLNEMANTE